MLLKSQVIFWCRYDDGANEKIFQARAVIFVVSYSEPRRLANWLDELLNLFSTFASSAASSFSFSSNVGEAVDMDEMIAVPLLVFIEFSPTDIGTVQNQDNFIENQVHMAASLIRDLTMNDPCAAYRLRPWLVQPCAQLDQSSSTDALKHGYYAGINWITRMLSRQKCYRDFVDGNLF